VNKYAIQFLDDLALGKRCRYDEKLDCFLVGTNSYSIEAYNQLPTSVRNAIMDLEYARSRAASFYLHDQAYNRIADPASNYDKMAQAVKNPENKNTEKSRKLTKYQELIETFEAYMMFFDEIIERLFGHNK